MPFNAGRPIMLSLVGDSGAGKSTLSNGCVELLVPRRHCDLPRRLSLARSRRTCPASYHCAASRLQSSRPHRTAHSAIALGREDLQAGLRSLRRHVRSARVRHADPDRADPRPARSYTAELRNLWDVSVYLDPDPELRIDWKIKRDMSKRGYTRAEVEKQLEERRHDSEPVISPRIGAIRCSGYGISDSFLKPRAQGRRAITASAIFRAGPELVAGLPLRELVRVGDPVADGQVQLRVLGGAQRSHSGFISSDGPW